MFQTPLLKLCLNAATIQRKIEPTQAQRVAELVSFFFCFLFFPSGGRRRLLGLGLPIVIAESHPHTHFAVTPLPPPLWRTGQPINVSPSSHL
jgi:hypothetical protein